MRAQAVGARDPARLRRAVRVTSELAFGSGFVIALIFFFGGGWVIETFILDPQAQAAALAYLPFCALMPIIGVAPFQLDGIFIGATQGRALRTAGVLAAIGYVATDYALRPYGNTGVWIAFLSMYFWRAGLLALFWPQLVRNVGVAQG